MNDDAGPPPVALLRDIPTELDDDSFGHASYAAVLVETLKNARQPATIGLFGPWGLGKSSVLWRVRRDLQSPQCSVVLFDAWRYDSATLRRQLVRDIAHEFERQAVIGKEFDVKRRLAELEVDRQVASTRTRFSWGGTGVAFVQAIAAGFALYVLMRLFPEVKESLLGQDPARGTLISLVFAVVVFGTGLISQVFRAVPYVEVHKRLEDPERFHDLFRDLVAAATVPRLVIAIDNLDRSAPANALELLATIKTYLEPAAREAHEKAGAIATETLFVLAVDEDALRRHLLSQASNTSLGEGRVDEYLRKIFNTTVRLAPLIGEDLRGYVEKRLGDARESLGLPKADERELVTMMDAALRRNPRQVIQFVNNLQLRLRLIRERERGEQPVIRGDIGTDVLVVAKLLLIEEVWPTRYTELVERPQLLESWHQDAREPGLASQREDWDRFAAFLRVTDRVRTDNLRPFIRLKQSLRELSLDDHDEFRAAALAGDRNTVGAILDRYGDKVDAYSARLEELFREELRAGYVTAARSILDVTLADARLAANEDRVLRLTRIAVDDPRLADEWEALPASSLLHAARTQQGGRRHRLISLVARRLATDAEDVAREAARALAANVELLDAEHREWIRAATGEPPLVGRYLELALLAEASDELIGERAAAAIARHVEHEPQILTEDDSSPVTQLLPHLAAQGTQAADAVCAALAAGSEHLLRSTSRAHTDVALDIAGGVLASGASVGPLIDRWLEMLARGAVADSERVVAFVWDHAALASLNALMAILINTDTPSLSFLEPRLGASPAKDSVVAAALAEAVQRLRNPGVVDRLFMRLDRGRIDIRQAALLYLNRRAERDAPVELVETFRERFALWDLPESRDLAATFAHRMRVAEDADEAVDWFDLFARIREPSSEAQQAATEALASLFGGHDPGDISDPLQRALSIARGLPRCKQLIGSAVKPVLRALRRQPPENEMRIVELLVAYEAFLDDMLRESLRTILLERLAERADERERWSELLTSLPPPGKSELREQFVATAIEREQATGSDTKTRGVILAAASEIVGDSPALRLRLAELEASANPDDRAVAAIVHVH